ncbi:MAG: YARHG domain-containing protein [Flavobacteriales bacterium]|jgi:hypothetical protein|nr:YARHG domain-containing protein [Flavobacteriales bacterium]
MKNRLIKVGCIGIILLASCSTATQEESSTTHSKTSKEDNSKVEDVKRMSSENIQEAELEPEKEKQSLTLNAKNECYVGQFEALDFDYEKGGMRSNKITIQFDSIVGDTLIYGHSVVAGNLRPFSGEVKIRDGFLSIDVNEPGDDQYDGRFIMDLKETELSGKWYANNSQLKVPVREFELTNKVFEYNPDLMLEVGWFNLYEYGKTKEGKVLDEEGEDYYIDEVVETLTEASSNINASTKLLTKEEVENLYKTDLEIIRNTIYARHGYSFKNRKIRNIFDAYVDWYIPFSTDVSKELTAVELKNIELIKRYEQHAETYYDSFGR